MEEFVDTTRIWVVLDWDPRPIGVKTQEVPFQWCPDIQFIPWVKEIHVWPLK